jgi:hypothetical protein
MDKVSIIVIPGPKGKSRSFHIPLSLIRSMALVSAIALLLVGILTYDYFKLISTAYRTKHLKVENRQLKEQIQVFQSKINTLTGDLERVEVFEKKLRILSGLDKSKLSQPFFDNRNGENNSPQNQDNYEQKIRSDFEKKVGIEKFQEKSDFKNLETLYKARIFEGQGLNQDYDELSFGQTAQASELATSFATFDYKYVLIKKVAKDLEGKLNKLDQFLLDKESLLKSTPVLLPVNGWITSFYGPRKNPASGRLRMHEGIDVGAPFGAPIVAPADGKVVFSGIKPGFGKHVQIDHGYGVETLFAHAQKLLVTKNQQIKRGDHLAQVGSTGSSTGPHLHYEVRINGIAVDPYYFILD